MCKPHNGNLPHYPYCYGPHYPNGGSTYRGAITIQTSNSINDKSESMHVIKTSGWYIFTSFLKTIYLLSKSTVILS